MYRNIQKRLICEKFGIPNKQIILHEEVSHGSVLHSPLSSSNVTLSPLVAVQFNPPCSGAGLSHKRVLMLVPFPHVREQSVQLPHSDQFPFTNIKMRY